MKKIRRVISFLLALVMVLGMLPTATVGAEETEPTVETVAVETVAEVTVAETTAATEETTVPTEAATEAPEETTAPTEAVTEPVEETTAPTEETTEDVITSEAMGSGTTVTSGTCGDNLTWALDSAGTLTISGTGTMSKCTCGSNNYLSYCSFSAPWGSMADQITCVILKEGITVVCQNTFRNCVNLKRVIMPSSVTHIGYARNSGGGAGTRDYGAFQDCAGITSIGPSGSGCDYEFAWTGRIPDGAFALMPGLEKIIMPKTITEIENGAFYGSQKAIVSAGMLGSGCDYEFSWETEIIKNAFSGFSSLETVIIPDGITSIADYAFQVCTGLTDLTLPDTLTSIGRYAFNGCSSLKTLTLPDSLTQIGENVFSNCGLESMVIPVGVLSIPDYAFSHCKSLKKITIPETVKELGTSAFYYCSALEHVEIQAPLTAIPGHCFTLCGSLKSIVIPETVTAIGNYAFSSCNSLTDIYFKGSYGQWKQITKGTNNDVLETAIIHCEKLDSGICGENTTWNLDREGKLTISGQGSVTEHPWYDLLNKIPLTEIVIEDGVTRVSVSFYHHRNAVEKITVAGSVNFTKAAFMNFDSIESAGPIGSGADYEFGWTTEISPYAFANIQTLKEITWPEGLQSIGDNAFCRCTALAEVELPETLKTIGMQAFSYCTSLERLVIPAGVTYCYGVVSNCSALTDLVILAPMTNLQGFMFTGCTSLKSITLPRSLRYIYSGVFAPCTSLTDIYFAGTEEEWNAVYKDQTGNEKLFDGSIQIHYAWNATYMQDVRFYDQWMAGQGLVYFGETDFSGCLVTEETDSAFTNNPTALLGTYVIVESRKEGAQEILLNMRPVETKTGTVTDTSQYYMVIDGESYITPIDMENPGQYQEKFVLFHLDNGNLVGIEQLFFDDYLDNDAITINGPGTATAYYRGTPYQKITYRVNGAEDTLYVKPNGIMSIPLGSFSSQGPHSVTIEIIKIGNIVLDPPLILDALVTVDPFCFEQTWQASFDASVGAVLTGGAYLKLSEVEIKGTLGHLESNLGVGTTLNVTRTYDGGKNALELTTDVALNAELEAFTGVNAEVKSTEFGLARISGKFDGGPTATLGIKLEDFSAERIDQQKALACYIMTPIVAAKPNNLVLRTVYGLALADLNKNADINSVIGSSISLTKEGKAGLGTVVVDGEDLFTLTSGGFSIFSSANEQKESHGTTSRSTAYTSNVNLSAFEVNPSIKDVDIDLGGAISKEFMGRDTEVSFSKSNSGEVLEASSLSSKSTAFNSFLLGENYTAYYHNYVFEDTVLNRLFRQYPHVDYYTDGYKKMLSVDDIRDIGDFISDSDMKIPYQNKVKEKAVWSLPLSIGAALGLGLNVGLTLSAMESTEYDQKKGVVLNDEFLISGESENVETMVANRKWSLDDLIINSLKSLPSLVQKVYRTKDALDDEWLQIIEQAENEASWKYLVTYAPPEAGDVPYDENSWQRQSFVIDVNNYQTVSVECTPGIESNLPEVATSHATTIGQLYILAVQDALTEEVVNDLSAYPPEMTIRYTKDDLEAAGLSQHNTVIQNGGIGIYRYSDDGDYFEYVGGVNDPEAMTVTTKITKPGMFVLAVDSCAPELKKLELSDFRTNPTITAYVNDMSGLDLSRFVFSLDGETKVNGGNIADHYNTNAGIFTYTVPEKEALAEGEHTMAFTLVDTTGNSETYEYTFSVDLTTPVISDVTVTGTTNEDSVVEIRAQVNDPNLTEVYAIFSKLLPDGTWSDEVGTPMGDMGDGLWGLDYEGDGSSVKVYVRAIDIGDNSVESEIFEIRPYAEEIEISQEYIALYDGQEYQLQAEVKPAELVANVKWRSDNTAIVTVDQTGLVTAKAPGTAYIIAKVTDAAGNELTARCRVDVTEAIRLNGVQLGATKLATELFSTDYAEFELLLELPQNQNASLMSVDRKDVPEDKGVAIDSIRFTASTTAVAFDLVALDDRRIAVVPTEYALENPKELAKTYKSAVTVTADGEEYTTDEILTLTVKQSKPKLKAKIDSFNSFYIGQTQQIAITGGTVTGITLNPDKPQPDWLTLNSDGTLSLNENAGTKNSGKAVLLVETAEWNIPAEVTLSVKNAYKAPGLKLSTSSVKMIEDAVASSGVSLTLQPKSKKDSLMSLNVADILAPDGYEVMNFRADTGSFTLKAEKGFCPGKITLQVMIYGTNETVPLTLTVSVQKVSLKLSAKTVTLNTALKDSAAVKVTATPTDYILANPTITGYDSEYLDVSCENGILTVGTTEKTVPNATYKLSISAGGSKEVALTVKTVEKTSTVSFKASGNLDLSLPNNAVAVKPTFKNYSGSFALAETETEHFTLTQAGNTIFVRCKDGTESGNYTQKLSLTLDGGTTIDGTVKLTVKRTAIKLKLSSSKLSLNSTIDDKTSVTVTCTTKGYTLTEPIVKVMDKSGKVASNGLDAAYSNGKLTVSVNGNTEPGATYKVLVQAYDGAPTVTLTVTILKENKSAITASLKAKGSIDVIRDGTAINLTPSYKNAGNLTDRTEKLEFFKTVKKETTSADGLFAYTRNTDGTYTITKAEGAALDHSTKYTVKLVTTIGSTEVASKTVSLTVKQGSAKLTLKSGSSILFAKDKYSRVNFTLTAADETMNSIETVTSKDTRFEVYSYGNGEFALGFADDSVIKSLAGKNVTVTLNIFLEGNETAKANTTAKLKVTILK